MKENYRPVLVGIESTTRSRPVLKQAVDLAEAFSTKLILFHVSPAPILAPVHPTAASVVSLPATEAVEDAQAVRTAWEEELERLASRMPASISVETRSAEGDPVLALHEAARECSFLVLGGSQRSFWSRLLERSVVHATLTDLPCTLVVVPITGESETPDP